MRFVRYASPLTAGAAGLFTGLAYHNISSKRRLLLSAAEPVSLSLDHIIAKDLQKYAAKFAPVMKHGFPSLDTLRIKGSYVLSYDRRNKVPYWVMEHLTSDMIENETCKSSRSRKFYEDETIHAYFRSTKKDFKDSGYDRGHLAAAANHRYSSTAKANTFALSNIAPQNPSFNQGIWERLESHVRNLAKKYGSVYVCSGPLYLCLPREEVLHLLQEPQEKYTKKKRNEIQSVDHQTKKYVIYEVIGENHVAVPTHFFKIIVCEVGDGMYDMEAYIIPNQPSCSKMPLKNFQFPRDVIERAAGFLLFHQIPPEKFRCINGKKAICL